MFMNWKVTGMKKYQNMIRDAHTSNFPYLFLKYFCALKYLWQTKVSSKRMRKRMWQLNVFTYHLHVSNSNSNLTNQQTNHPRSILKILSSSHRNGCGNLHKAILHLSFILFLQEKPQPQIKDALFCHPSQSLSQLLQPSWKGKKRVIWYLSLIGL